MKTRRIRTKKEAVYCQIDAPMSEKCHDNNRFTKANQPEYAKILPQTSSEVSLL